MRMGGENTERPTVIDSRYRALLNVASAIAEQPTVKAVLHSLRGLLSSASRLHGGGTELYVLGDDEKTLHLFAFDRDADAPAIKTGTKILCIGAAARVLEEQNPVFLADVSQEMLKDPELAPFAAQAVGSSTYLLPVSTSNKQYGILALTKLSGEEFVPEDVELLRSLASHVAVALECALARDRAEQYQCELGRERDRLRLLLEINNQVISKLDINELFRAASASIRSYFGSDYTAIWVLKEESGQLENILYDFPGGKGIAKDASACLTPADLTAPYFEKLRTHRAEIWSVEDIRACSH
jgi:formate hydrogenlyase transcriptional activator